MLPIHIILSALVIVKAMLAKYTWEACKCVIMYICMSVYLYVCL